jgi:hypothetical protein
VQVLVGASLPPPTYRHAVERPADKEGPGALIGRRLYFPLRDLCGDIVNYDEDLKMFKVHVFRSSILHEFEVELLGQVEVWRRMISEASNLWGNCFYENL